MEANGTFGHWLKQRRKALDLTQAELADQLGCATVTIRKFESDERRPSKQISERMADVLAIASEERDDFVVFARQLEASVTDDWVESRPSSNLPPQSTPFVGREDELAQIAERLADPTCRLLTLLGPGGMGKTRLALQAAAVQLHTFRDGVYFVSLTPVGATTFIPSAIASALAFSFYGQDEPQVQIVNYLRGKEILLVMDNYEHLLSGIDLLTALLTNAPRLKLLVTSRERLNLQEEWLLPLVGLPYPTQDFEDGLSRYPAVTLFVETARRLQPSFVPAGNEAAIAEICRAVEGMPLGLELAATWLRAMPCAQIAEQIQRDLDFLATPLRNVPERHRSLRAIFEHSWDLLSDDERDVLMKLSVFRGACDLEAAATLAEADLSMLAGLVDKSLLRINGQGRYEMQELLRQFAADKLAESALVVETRNCHLQCYLDLAEALELRFFGPENRMTLDRLETEHDNFRAALDWAAESGDIEAGLRLAGALGWFWNRRDYWVEGRQRLEKLVALGIHAPVPLRAKAIHHAIELTSELGDNDAAAMHYEGGVTLVSEVEDSGAKAWLLTGLGFFDYCPGDLQAVRLEEALALFRMLDDQWGMCETLVRLAHVLFRHGNYARAAQLHEEGIRLARKAGDKSVLSWLLFGSALRSWYEGGTDQDTEQLLRESLALFRELRYKNGTAIAWYNLGMLADRRGNEKQARTLFKRSLKLSQQVNSRYCAVLCLVSLAEMFLRDGALEHAARLLETVSDYLHDNPLVDSGAGLTQDGEPLYYARAITALRSQLDPATSTVSFAGGLKMSLDEAISYALEKLK